MKVNIWKVYKWESKTTGKCYIGITSRSIKKRSGVYMQHYKSCRVFWNAIKKYGAGDFVLEILHRGLSYNEAEEMEIQEIKSRNTLCPNGYNLTTGGSTPEMSDSTRQRISEVKLNQSPEVGRKISESLRGRKHTEESRLKMSESQRNRKDVRGQKLSVEARQQISNSLRGKKRPEETKRKISETQRGRVFSEETRSKISINRKAAGTRKRVKCRWMFILSAARVLYETYGYREKRRKFLLEKGIVDTSQAEQMEMFATEN